MADNIHNFQLELDTTAPDLPAVSPTTLFFKENTPNSIQLTSTGASYMKLWWNQSATAATTDPDVPAVWTAFAATATPTLTVEGVNYGHCMTMDTVANKSGIGTSVAVLYDKTPPVVTSVVINDGADVAGTQTVNVKVTATDGGTGYNSYSFKNNSGQAGDARVFTHKPPVAVTVGETTQYYFEESPSLWDAEGNAYTPTAGGSIFKIVSEGTGAATKYYIKVFSDETESATDLGYATYTSTENVYTKSDIASCTLKGDLKLSEGATEVSFAWTDLDRQRGWKVVQVTLSDNATATRETKIIKAYTTDRAGNVGETNQSSIIYYSGGIDPVVIIRSLWKGAKSVTTNKTNLKDLEIELKVLVGPEVESQIKQYKLWGSWTDAGVSQETEPTTWTDWTTGGVLKQNLIWIDKSAAVPAYENYVNVKVALELQTVTDLPAESTIGTIVKNGINYQHYIYTKEGTETTPSWKHIEHDDVPWVVVDSTYSRTVDKVTIMFDEVRPIVTSMTTSKAFISAVTGFDSVTLTATLDSASDGMKIIAYTTKEAAQADMQTIMTTEDGRVEGLATATNVGLQSDTPVAAGGTWVATLTNSQYSNVIAADQAGYLVCYCKDLYGNWGCFTCDPTPANPTIVTRDNTAPTATITVNQYYKDTTGVVFTYTATDTGSGVAKMASWTDNDINAVNPPEGTAEVDYSPTMSAADLNWQATESLQCYAHIRFKDAVGNAFTKTSTAFCYDKTVPTITSVAGPSLTNTVDIVVTIDASDSMSGLDKVKVTGDVDDSYTTDWQNWPNDKKLSVKLSSTNGVKNLIFTVKDKAGNESTTYTAYKPTLDTEAPSPSLTLYKEDYSETLPSTINYHAFSMRIAPVDTTDIDNIAEYLVWGDFVGGAATEGAATWMTFQKKSASDLYMELANKQFSEGDGEKYVYLKLKDKAGNISATAATKKTTVDTVPPEIIVSNVDYTIVSKIAEVRQNPAKAGDLCNTMTFNFVCNNSKLVEWKVCVWKSGQTPAAAVAIGTSGGSVNTTGGTKEMGVPVAVTIKGSDYEDRLKLDDPGKTSWDGVYDVIVYGREESGSWSQGKA